MKYEKIQLKILSEKSKQKYIETGNIQIEQVKTEKNQKRKNQSQENQK